MVGEGVDHVGSYGSNADEDISVFNLGLVKGFPDPYTSKMHHCKHLSA